MSLNCDSIFFGPEASVLESSVWAHAAHLNVVSDGEEAKKRWASKQRVLRQ